MFLTSSCSSPSASPSSPLSLKEAPRPCLRLSTKNKIDTEPPENRLLHFTRGEDAHERKALEQEKQLNVVDEADEQELWRPEEKLKGEKTEGRERLKEEEQLGVVERAPEVELLRQEHELQVVVHAGGGGGRSGSHSILAYPETYIGDEATVRTASKRWSFCYGESDLLSLLPKASQSTGSRDDSRLAEPRCDSRKARPS